MLRTMVVAALAVMFLCGFAPPGEKDPVTGKDRPKPHKPKEASQTTAMMVNMYKDGTMKAVYWAGVHADPKAGQYWVTTTTSDFGGNKMEMVSAWQVVKVDGDKAILENDVGQGYIIAYEVALKKKPEDGPNVTKAWIGEVGGKGEEIGIMEGPKPAAAKGDAPEVPGVKTTTEDFKGLELAGGTWSGKKTTTDISGSKSTVWIAENGWFGGLVKMEFAMEMGSTNMVLTSQGENGEPWLKWEEAAKEPKKEEAKKEEPKKEEAAPAKPAEPGKG